MFRDLKERLTEAIKGKKVGILVFGEKQYGGKTYPRPTFDKLNDILLGDPDTAAAIAFITDVVMGLGIETTMNRDYAEKTADGLTAKELIDLRSEEYGLDQIIGELTHDIIGYGNSVIWRGDDGKQLIRILPSTIQEFRWDKESGMILEELVTKNKTFSADELIWFAFNRVGKNPVGYGILQALGTALRYGGVTRNPMATIKAKIQQAMATQIENFSAPNQMWVLPDVPDKLLTEYHSKIQRLKKGERLAFNKPGASVIQAVPERMRGLDFYVEILWNSYYLALQTPLPKLFTTPGFTQASAAAALAMGERKVFRLQRYIKRMIEREIYAPWLEAEGLDPKKANVRLHWRMIQRPDTNVLLPVIQRARESRDLSQEEFRTILAEMGLPIDPKEKVVEEPLQKKPGEQIPRPTQPIESKRKVYEETPGRAERSE